MPRAATVTLKAGVNHLLAKITNNRHAYGFAFSIKGLHPELRHERGSQRMWRGHITDLPSEWPYHMESGRAAPKLNPDQQYREALRRLRELKFHPEPMPGVETAALDSKGRIVPAMEARLERHPTSPAGDRHTKRLAALERRVKPLLKRIDNTGEPMRQEVLATAKALDDLWAATIREMPKLVYLERPTYVYDSMMYESAGAKDGVIKAFDPETKKIRTILNLRSVKGSANEISVSWDAKTILIGGGRTVAAVGSDGKNYRRITSGQSPVEMADGRIVFFDADVGQAPCKSGGPRRLLFICDPDGKNRRLVSANTCIDTAPSVMHDGRVVFARWDYGVNKNVFNRHALWTQNPDGTGMDLFFGNTVIDPRSFSRPHQVPGRPEVLAIFAPHHAKLAGLLGLVWNGDGREAPDGLGFRRLTHDTASVGDSPQVWSYQDPCPLNEQLFLVSFGGRPGRKVALYVYDRSGNRKCILEAASGRGIHSAKPLAARKRPVKIVDRSVPTQWKSGVDLHERLLTDPDWRGRHDLVREPVPGIGAGGEGWVGAFRGAGAAQHLLPRPRQARADADDAGLGLSRDAGRAPELRGLSRTAQGDHGAAGAGRDAAGDAQAARAAEAAGLGNARDHRVRGRRPARLRRVLHQVPQRAASKRPAEPDRGQDHGLQHVVHATDRRRIRSLHARHRQHARATDERLRRTGAAQPGVASEQADEVHHGSQALQEGDPL